MKTVHCVNGTFVSFISITGRRGKLEMPEERVDHQFFNVDELLRTIRFTDTPVIQDTDENRESNERLRVLGERLRKKLSKGAYLVQYDHQWYDSKGNTRTSPAEVKIQRWSAFSLGVLAGIVSTILVSWVIPYLLRNLQALIGR